MVTQYRTELNLPILYSKTKILEIENERSGSRGTGNN